MAVGSVSFPTPQAYSGGIDWSPLANLGNVYQQAQARERQQAALGQLGNDPTANAQALIRSGDTSLAQMGLNLQQKTIEQQREDAQNAERRREFDEQQKLRVAQDLRAQAAEKRAAAGEARTQADWEEASVEGRTKKIIAAGGNPDAPEWQTYKINGTSPPDYYKGQDLTIRQNADIRANDEANRKKIEFEQGQALATQEGREKALKSAGIDINNPDWQTWRVTGANAPDQNKIQKTMELSPTEKKMAEAADEKAYFARDVLNNIKRMREISPKVLGGIGAYAVGPLQQWGLGDVPGVKETEEMKQLAGLNVADQAKATFGSRLAVKEFQFLKDLEGTPHMSDASRQTLYDNVDRVMKHKAEVAEAEAAGIRGRTYFKPGGNQPTTTETTAPPTTTPPTTTAPAEPTNLAKPSDRIINKAKAAIAQGGDKAAIRQHLIDNGYDPGDIGK